MTTTEPKKPTIREFLRGFVFWFLLIYVLFSLFELFTNKKDKQEDTAVPTVSSMIEISPVKSKNVIGLVPQWTIRNTGTTSQSFADPCTEAGVFRLERVVSGTLMDLWKPEYCDIQPMEGFVLEAEQSVTIAFPMINEKVFNEVGEYRMIMGFNDTEYTSSTLNMREPKLLRRLFRTLIKQPIFNALVGIIHVLPGHNLGWAVVLLTLIIRLILFIPNQRAIRSQEAMKKIQPKLKALQEQYKDNQQMLAMKTMEMYKKHKVSPISSCLPILLQMPILLGLYYTVMEGISPHLEYLLYPFLKRADLAAVDHFWLTMDMSDMNITQWKYALLVAAVALVQFISLRISLGRNKKKRAAEKEKKAPGLKNSASNTPNMAEQMQDMMGMMQYIFPIMIAFFASSLPAVVGLYWLTSTTIGAVQQWWVHKQLSTPETTRRTGP